MRSLMKIAKAPLKTTSLKTGNRVALLLLAGIALFVLGWVGGTWNAWSKCIPIF